MPAACLSRVMFVHSTKGLTTAPVATLTAAHIQAGRLRTRVSWLIRREASTCEMVRRADTRAKVHSRKALLDSVLKHSLKKTEKKQAVWPSRECDVTASAHLSWQVSTTEGRTRLNNGMLTAMEKMGGMKRYGTGTVSTKGGRRRGLGEDIVARCRLQG